MFKNYQPRRGEIFIENDKPTNSELRRSDIIEIFSIINRIPAFAGISKWDR